MYRAFITIFIITSIFVGCNNNDQEILSYVNGFKYNTQDRQEEIINALRENNISLIIDKDGFVTYQDSHVGKVDKIIKEIETRPHIEFFKKQYSDKFIFLLEQNNIEHYVKFFHDKKIQIFWSREKDTEVRMIIREDFPALFKN